MKQQNGLLPGWPPFTEFKQEMAKLVDLKIEPIKRDLSTVKESLVSHIQKTDENFKEVKLALANHITDTNKKIDALSEKMDKLLSKTP